MKGKTKNIKTGYQMAIKAPKEVAVKYLKVISLDSNFSSVAFQMAEVWINF